MRMLCAGWPTPMVRKPVGPLRNAWTGSVRLASRSMVSMAASSSTVVRTSIGSPRLHSSFIDPSPSPTLPLRGREIRRGHGPFFDVRRNIARHSPQGSGDLGERAELRIGGQVEGGVAQGLEALPED